MVDASAYFLIAEVALCFGVIVGFQIAHIRYCRRLISFARRSLDSGTLAPIFAELERLTGNL
jgi:hypothetical protein